MSAGTGVGVGRGVLERTASAIRSHSADERGITLAELIVAIMLFGLVSVLVSGFFFTTNQTIIVAEALNTNTKQASNGINETARIIRAGTENPLQNTATNAPAFVIASDESLIMYAYVNLQSSDQTPIMVKLYLDTDRNLIERQWAAIALGNGYWSFPDPNNATPSSVRILASSVAPAETGRPPLFRYLKADGTPLTNTTLDDQRRTIAAVTVTLTIQEPGATNEQRVTLQNTVGIPNLGIHRTVS